MIWFVCTTWACNVTYVCDECFSLFYPHIASCVILSVMGKDAQKMSVFSLRYSQSNWTFHKWWETTTTKPICFFFFDFRFKHLKRNMYICEYIHWNGRQVGIWLWKKKKKNGKIFEINKRNVNRKIETIQVSNIRLRHYKLPLPLKWVNDCAMKSMFLCRKEKKGVISSIILNGKWSLW